MKKSGRQTMSRSTGSRFSTLSNGRQTMSKQSESNGHQTMGEQSESNGFTTIELLITLFIAAAFLVSGYQLYNLIIKDGGETRTQTRASNVAYDYLQRYKPSATTPCTTQTPLTNAAPNPVPVNLSNVTVTVQITCPYGITSSVSKVQVNLGYGNPQQTISNATYVSYPGLVTNGLLMNLDAGSRRSIINWDSWTVGVGGTTGYSPNGDGNSRIIDTNPWGASDVVWDVNNQDAVSDADGGWNGSYFPIDNTKMYRFTTFVRRKTIGNGSFYFGTSGGGASVLNRSNGAVNSNPYFSNAAWWGPVNQWYLVVGYVWPAGSGTGVTMPETGIYALDGTKVQAGSDFIWQPTTTSSNHRSYLYYSTDVTTNQQWYQPRVDIINGTEPTVTELLNNAENTWVDLSGNGHNGAISGATYNSNNGGSFAFDGVNDAISLGTGNTFFPLPNFSMELWFKSNGTTPTTGISPGLLGITYGIRLLVFSSYLYFGLDNNGALPTDLNTNGTYSFYNSSWHQVVIQANSTTRYIYVDGVLSNTLTAGWPGATRWPTNTANIGRDNNDNVYFFTGNIASVKFYNRVLSASEVNQNFNALRSRYGI